MRQVKIVLKGPDVFCKPFMHGVTYKGVWVPGNSQGVTDSEWSKLDAWGSACS